MAMLNNLRVYVQNGKEPGARLARLGILHNIFYAFFFNFSWGKGVYTFIALNAHYMVYQ